MLPLHIFAGWDIINTHLFESFTKTKKIRKNEKRPYLRDRSFFIYNALI